MPVDKGTDAADAGPGVDPSSHVAHSREEFISETLDWCAELFRSQRARFVRPTESGGWIVYTRQNNVLSTHEADYAEAAMARAVGLGRHPLVVTRPRVTRPGTTDLRPISVSSYLGIPLISQDRLVGVIECAGEARPDIEAALQVALPRLELA
ncbi:MAG TPA: GAF domain-containing protein, partial [Egibacteraceae bacterium]|nr:GAF domain-containing protein [Egibacteraceae bacterium]